MVCCVICRPGDTIWLAPGLVHDATNIAITQPLHIMGGGLLPEDTQLTAAPGGTGPLCPETCQHKRSHLAPGLPDTLFITVCGCTAVLCHCWAVWEFGSTLSADAAA
jgi:hypothetical protein